jgi:hypothetical protein
MLVTCTWIAHLPTPPSDLEVGNQVCWSDTHVVSWYYCSLNVVGAHVLPFGARWSLRAAASTDGKNVGSMGKNYNCHRGVELDTRGWSDRIILTRGRQPVPFGL